jgi:hypothetical protein
MRSKLSVLAILAALAALALPSSSLGAMYPAGHKFEIAKDSSGSYLSLSTSLGSCAVTKITAQIPAAPLNESINIVPASTPTIGSCTAGTSVALSSEWVFSQAGPDPYEFGVSGTSGESIIMRFASLPGCKLIGQGIIQGLWSNGVTTPHFLASGFHAERIQPLTWANDGASCALAGTHENVTALSTRQVTNKVTDITNPASLITVAPNK